MLCTMLRNPVQEIFFTAFSQEFKQINVQAQDVLSYFNTKNGAILPYSVQVRKDLKELLDYSLFLI
jgi:hypothetical protein